METQGITVTYLVKKLKFNKELLTWVTTLLVIFLAPMDGPSLCFFKWIGIGFCPGCGLAHAMQEAMHLHLKSSLNQHPLGIAAVLVLLYRIYILTFTQNNPHAKQEFHDARSGDRT